MKRKITFIILLALVFSLCISSAATSFAESKSPEITVYPDQKNAAKDAYGDYEFTETAIAIDYEGIEIAATLAMPVTDENVPFIILCHGYTGSQNHFNAYSKVYASNGIGNLRFDFPANGKSGGDSTEISLLTEKKVLEFLLDYSKTIPGVNENQIFLGGQSMGGAVATLCGVEHQDEICGLILCFPGYPIPDFTRKGVVLGTEFDLDNLPETLEIYNYTVGSVFITDALDIDFYNDILPRMEKDVLIFHGTNDDMIDLEYSRQAVEVLPSARLVVVDGYGHGFPGFVLADIMPISVDFIREHCE